jgi:hypothetical protein
MLENGRMSDKSVHFYINGLALLAICTHRLDLIQLIDTLTAGYNIEMPDIAKWPNTLSLQLNDMEFPTGMCYPSVFRERRKLKISIRLPHGNGMSTDRLTIPAIFLKLIIIDNTKINTLKDRIIHHLHFINRLQFTYLKRIAILDVYTQIQSKAWSKVVFTRSLELPFRVGSPILEKDSDA